VIFSHDMLVATMGEEPPTDYKEASSYFLTWLDMVREEYGAKQESLIWLMGCGPDCFYRWASLRAEENAAKVYKRKWAPPKRIDYGMQEI
jgi:hypothetical protein